MSVKEKAFPTNWLTIQAFYQKLSIEISLYILDLRGVLQEERESFTGTILGSGLTDAFRRQHPEMVAYTYFGYRMNMRWLGPRARQCPKP